MISKGASIYLSSDNILTGFNSIKIDDKQNNCSELEGMILSLINKRAISIDPIKSMMGLTDEKIEELLFEMEIRGDIKQSRGVFTQSKGSHHC